MERHFTPMRMMLYGISAYLIVFILGPYSWEIRSWEAILCLVIGLLCIISGMIFYNYFSKNYKVVIGRRTRFSNETEGLYELSRTSEMVLVFIDLVALLCFLLYMRDISMYVTFSGLGEITDSRYALSDNLSFMQKLVNYSVLASIPVYIISGYEESIKLKLLQYLRTICFWLPAISFLVTSARWNFIFSLFVFFFVNYDNKNSSVRKHAKTKKKGALISYILIGAMLFVTLTLFQTRGYNTSIPDTILHYGHVNIKQWYLNIPFLGKGFYQLNMYITHSVPYYADVFDTITYSHPQYGTYAFAHLRIFFSAFRNWKEFVKYNPYLTGNYTPTITGFFIDWGFVGAFIMMFLTGILFQWIYKNPNRLPILKYILPVVLFQSFMCLEGYVYTIAATNIIVFIIILVGIGVRLINNASYQ